MQKLLCRCLSAGGPLPQTANYFLDSVRCYNRVPSSLPLYYLKRTYSTMDDNGLQPPTAGIIVIGDELLKGQTQDTNGSFIANRLRKLGVKVKRISIIGDDLATISEEIRQFSERYTHVVSTGGIGPTHDDLTLQGVAEAFQETLVPHPDLVAIIGSYFKTDDLSSPPMKMAHIPSSSELVYASDKDSGYISKFPVIIVRNVTVLPGVPYLMEKAVTLLDKRLFGDHQRVSSCDVYLKLDEVSIATALNNTVTEHPGVAIGSYPHLLHSYYKTHLTLEAADTASVEAAKQHFFAQISPDAELKDYVTDSVSGAWPRLQALLERDEGLRASVDSAISVLDQTLQRYKPEEICVCFNGGKDCLAVLHLFYAALHRDNPALLTETESGGKEASNATKRKSGGRLQAVYITEENTFPQITQFVNQTINRYELDCSIIPGPLKTALATLQQRKPGIKAVIMGTRQTDPYSASLSTFQPTDGDWPSFMRVSPILEWRYSAVWDFIRGLYLPYCTLYDRGYTSLGNASNTEPNPQLLTQDRLGRPTYRPAYMLQDPQCERQGRS